MNDLFNFKPQQIELKVSIKVEPYNTDVFPIDDSHPVFAGMDEFLVQDIAYLVGEFSTSALEDRTYDEGALLGSLLQQYDRKTCRKILLLLTQLPNSPICVVPQSKPGKERYALRDLNETSEARNF